MGFNIRKSETDANVALRRVPVFVQKPDGTIPADFTGITFLYRKPAAGADTDVGSQVTPVGAGTGRGYIELTQAQCDTAGLGWISWSGAGVVATADWVQVDLRDAQVANAVWDETNFANHFAAGSFGEGLQLLLGLSLGNIIIDNYIYGAQNVVTSMRARMWRDAGSMPGSPGGAGAQGSVATFTGTGVDAGSGQLSSWQLKRTA